MHMYVHHMISSTDDGMVYGIWNGMINGPSHACDVSALKAKKRLRMMWSSMAIALLYIYDDRMSECACANDAINGSGRWAAMSPNRVAQQRAYVSEWLNKAVAMFLAITNHCHRIADISRSFLHNYYTPSYNMHIIVYISYAYISPCITIYIIIIIIWMIYEWCGTNAFHRNHCKTQATLSLHLTYSPHIIIAHYSTSSPINHQPLTHIYVCC